MFLTWAHLLLSTPPSKRHELYRLSLKKKNGLAPQNRKRRTLFILPRLPNHVNWLLRMTIDFVSRVIRNQMGIRAKYCVTSFKIKLPGSRGNLCLAIAWFCSNAKRPMPKQEVVSPLCEEEIKSVKGASDSLCSVPDVQQLDCLLTHVYFPNHTLTIV